MHFHLRQVAIGSNDRPKHNLSFIAIEARSAGIAFDFSQSPSQQFGQPAMIDFDSGSWAGCHRRLRRGSLTTGSASRLRQLLLLGNRTLDR